MKDEIIACINREDVKFLHSGQISKYIFPLSRKEAHRKKICHLVIRVFIVAITPKKEVFYLVQKRGPKKDTYPNYFTDSASGHVEYHKRLDFVKIKENALRELEEEFGINVNDVIDLKFQDLTIEDDVEEATEVAYVFFGLVKYTVKLKPNSEELDLSASRFYTRNELKTIISKEKLVDHSRIIWKLILSKDLSKLFDNGSQSNGNNNIALFIGRFQPLHFGHLYVIKEILKSSKLLKIAIGSAQLSYSKNDPFTGAEREEFLRAALSKRNIKDTLYKIYQIPDVFNAEKWVSHLVSIVGRFDIVYSNSEWVRQLFKNEGYKVGKKIEIFKKKFNGSNVRSLIKNDKKIWRNLVPNEVISMMKEYNGINRIKSST